MGPPPFGDGNMARKFLPSPRCSELQWGHRLSAVETALGFVAVVMGYLTLQWGHRLSAVETMGIGHTQDLYQLLQWGHRLSAMETDTQAGVAPRDGVASMGPPPFGDGNSYLRVSSVVF